MGAAKKSRYYLLIASLQIALAFIFIGLLGSPTSVSAAVGINSQLSFEGKIVKSDGTNIADGTYNMEFKIYQDGNNLGSGSTLKWTEDWLVGGSGGVTLNSGTFQVNLGAHNVFGSQVDWNQDTLWLSLQIGNTTSCTITTTFQSNCSGDGEMTPYIRLTAVPYAQRAQAANTLGGSLTAANFVQLAQGLQVDSSTTNDSIAINKTGITANILTLQKSGASVMVIDNNGLVTLQPAAPLTGTGTQNHTNQSLTNNQTAGTVNGYNQSITVSNASGTTTTNGLKLSITDGTAFANTNNIINASLTDNGSTGKVNAGINLSLAGTNTSQSQYGVTAAVNAGAGIRGSSSGVSGGSITCGPTTATLSIGVCGSTSLASASGYGGYFAATGNGGNALYATNGTSTSNIFDLQDGTTDVLVVADGGAATIHPNQDVAALTVRQTGAASPTKDIIDVQNSAATQNFLSLSLASSTPHLKVFDSVGTNYADIYYSGGNAYFGTNSGTAVLGSGTGSVGITAGTGSGFTITGDAASSLVTNAGAGKNLTIDSGSGTLLLGTNTTTIQKSAAALTLDLTNASNSTLTVTNSGAGNITLGLKSGGSYAVGASTGSTISACTANNYIASFAAIGGIVTGGSCSTIASTNLSDSSNLARLNTANTFQNSTNSANAFQVKNQGGSSIFNIDNTKSNANDLVANSSFETAISNWSALNAGAASQSAAQAYEGSNSLLITTGTNASGGGASYTTGATFLANGTTYTLSAYVKTDSSLLVSTFEMGHADNGSTPTLVPCLTGQTLPKNGGWTQFTCTWTSGTITGSPFIYFKQTDAVNRNLYVDDILLQTDANADTNYRNAAINFTGATINGAVILQNSVNSNNAFQVQNASGNGIFNIDTTDTNLISNPGFEANATGWSAVTSATIVRDSTKAYLGNYSLKVAIASAATGGTQFSLNPIATAASTSYTVSFFAWLNSGTAPTFQVTYSPDGTATSTCSPSGTIATTGWMRLSCSGLTSATAPTTSGYLKIAQTNSAISTWNLDGVQLEASASASAYGAGAVSLNGVITSPVVFKSPAATTAFQIQGSSNLAILVADTVNDVIQIGSSTTDTTAVQLILDSYNNSGTAGDPTAVANGAMYYNTFANVFRCRQNGIWRNCIETPNNASTADQSLAAASTTYLTGSNITIPPSGLQAGTQFIWRISVNKTDAAATAANSFLIKYGTNGTTADTTEVTLAGPTQTAVTDNGLITVILTVRSVSATGTWYGALELAHNGNTTGLATVPAYTTNAVSASFADTTSNAIVGIAVTTAASCTLTVHQVQTQTVNL